VSLPDSDQVTKIILAALVGSVLTGGGQWMLQGRNVVTRTEMEAYVNGQSPYVKDSKYIISRLDEIARGVGRLDDIERRLAKLEAQYESQARR
jgi:hypothetical protein